MGQNINKGSLSEELRSYFKFPTLLRPLRPPRRKVLFRFTMLAILLVLIFIYVEASPLLGKRSPVFALQNDELLLYSLVNSPANKDVFTKLRFSDNAYFDIDLNVVGTLDFPEAHQYQRQPYVSNGYIGSRIPNLGQGFAYDTLSDSVDALVDDLSNGWPLFNKRYAGAFVAGFYNAQERTNGTNFPWMLQYGYESVITAVPQWTTLVLSTTHLGEKYTLDALLDPSAWGEISSYQQNLSLANGVVSTLFTWLETYRVQFDVLAHRDNINLGVVELKVENIGDDAGEVKVESVLDFTTAQRARLNSSNVDQDGIYMLYSPDNVDYVYGATYSRLDVDMTRCVEYVLGASTSRATQTAVFNLEPGITIAVTKYVGIFTSDLDPDTYDSFSSVLKAAKSTATSQKKLADVVSTHKSAWADTLGRTLNADIPNDRLLTLAVRASIYHLSANSRPHANGVTAAMGVGGQSSDSYGGLVFWDTDLWMLPGLLAFNPVHARSYINYRVHTHDQAVANLQSPLRPKDFKGAAYPWTSGRFANCTATGPCFDYEYHLNTAISISAWELYLSGAADETFLEEIAYPLVNDAALLLTSYVEYNDTLKQYTTRNLTDPDEFANHVDNGAYTNAGISTNLRFASMIAQHLGKEVPEEYGKIIGNVHLPLSADDPNIVLEYTGMNSSVGIKQADVILITYPLENEQISTEQAISNADYYSAKQVSFGPAMTFPIFSIVASALEETGCSAQSYLLKSVQPFLRGPFAQFSEQNNDDYKTNGGTHPAFPFMTAHGGLLQAILQGLFGFRFSYRVENGKIHRVLRFEPLYMPQYSSGVYLDGVNYLNHTLSLNLTESGLHVFNHGPSKNVNSPVLEIEITLGHKLNNSTVIKLSPGDEVVLPVFAAQQAYPDSLSECSSAIFTNITDGAYGDATVSVNDGDNTTHWQAHANSSSKILVDFLKPTKITKGFINWGDRPPTTLKLLASTEEAEKLLLTNAILAGVDFGNDLYEKYSVFKIGSSIIPARDAFHEVLSEDVVITEPFDYERSQKIVLTSLYNVTEFQFDSLVARYVLLDFEGVHDSADDLGAKVYEVNFF